MDARRVRVSRESITMAGELKGKEAGIAREYEKGSTTGGLAAKHKVSSAAIYKALKRMGKKMRPREETSRKGHEVNEGAFDRLTSAAKYWVGFLMADGNVTSSAEGRAPVIGMDLEAGDGNHVAEFAKFVGASHAIAVKPREDGRKSAAIGFRSQQMADKLASYGVVPRKNADGKQKFMTNIDKCPCAWRGYVDGNGTLLADGEPKLEVSGAKALLVQFARFTKAKTGEAVDVKPVSGAAVYRVRLSGDTAFKMVKALYQGGGPVLSRKKKIAEKILRRTKGEDGKTG